MNKNRKKQTIRIEGMAVPVYSANTLVIGSGAAALNAAVNLVDLGQEDVIIVTDHWGGGTSNNAGSDKQTYYKLSLSGGMPDSAVDMANDLFRGGCMHGDIALCEAAHSAQAFFRLVQLGVPFPHDRFGGFAGYRTDHDLKGRGTSAGPLTSQLMFRALEREVKRLGIPVFDRHEVIALLTASAEQEKCVTGAVALNRVNPETENMGLVVFNAVNVVFGTGGPAGMYKTSVYPECQSGSTGIALKAGAVAQNLTESQFGLASLKFRWNLSGSYQQVIPRYISTARDGSDQKEFLSDFFPDAGTLGTAIFLKGYQWPFDPAKIRNYGSSLIDLLVYDEAVRKGRRVFLDYRRNPEGMESNGVFSHHLLGDEARTYLEKSGALENTPVERLKSLNRPAVDLYLNHGINLSGELLEIGVCVQHNNGGLTGNIWWESNIRHLFPVGEVNGSHGVYRPGGAALNAGQVGGLRAAMFITKRYNAKPLPVAEFMEKIQHQVRLLADQCRHFLQQGTGKASCPESVITEIQERMSKAAGIVRQKEEITEATREARGLYRLVEKNLKVSSPDRLPAAFKALDHCLTHWLYLEAIGEYLIREGRSRGSFLIPDPQGKPVTGLPGKDWLFRLPEKKDFVNRHILEISLNENETVRKEWVKIRPVPDADQWFETTWKEFREGKIF